jgi:hypothetical protein
MRFIQGAAKYGQSVPLLPGNSSPHQSPPKAADEDPSIAVGPSMPASFTSTDSESEITTNPPSIKSPPQSGLV